MAVEDKQTSFDRPLHAQPEKRVTSAVSDPGAALHHDKYVKKRKMGEEGGTKKKTNRNNGEVTIQMNLPNACFAEMIWLLLQ